MKFCTLFFTTIIFTTAPEKTTNLKSAEQALKLLPEETTVNKQLIFDLILATKNHLATGMNDEKWLIDFDLKVLAKAEEDYAIYAKQIRKEFSIYPDFLYNPGRKKALEHFLKKDFIYQTESFRKYFETKARENIQQEIDRL